MTTNWHDLTRSQRIALLTLGRHGPCDLNPRLGEQLRNMGLADLLTVGGYCVSPLGRTLTQISGGHAEPISTNDLIDLECSGLCDDGSSAVS